MENSSARYALIYSDESMNVLGPKAKQPDAETIAIRDDEKQHDPEKMTTVAAVLVTVIEDYGKPALGFWGSRALINDPVLTKTARALKIAVEALEALDRNYDSAFARDELARIRTLVPEVDA